MALRSFVRLFAFTVLATLFVGSVGCSELTGGKDSSKDSSRSDDRISSGRTSSSDRLDISGLPRDAEVLDQGTGTVSVKARDRGTIYLVDADSGKLIWSGRIERGERFTVDPDNDRAAIDGRNVYDRNLERKDRHAVYFVPGDSSTYRDSRDSRDSRDTRDTRDPRSTY